MPPNKGGNSKKEAGRARKEENENAKKSKVTAEKEAAVAKDWEDGAKSNAKAEAARAKAAEAERKKAEKAALLAAEEAALPSKPKPQVTGAAAKKKVAPAPSKKAKEKESARPAGPGALAAGGGLGGNLDGVSNASTNGLDDDKDKETVHLAATGIDNMLEALELVNAKTDKSSVGAKAGMVEKHPERRFKAAFEAYMEREMPTLKVEHPGLRKQQMHDILFKQFQKSPENPFNQVTAAYNATKDDRVDALKTQLQAKEQKFKVQE